MDMSRWPSAKFVEMIILGDPVEPALASEILRRTDSVFQRQNPHHRLPPQALTIRQQTGFPSVDDPAPIAAWREAWGALDLIWLANHQITAASGWCRPDGSITYAGELEDYPLGEEILEDCRRLAAAFPDLSMDVALWGCYSPFGFPGRPLLDAPESPWDDEFLASITNPSAAILIGDGQAEAANGTDTRLFARFGLRCPQAVETAVRQHRMPKAKIPEHLKR